RECMYMLQDTKARGFYFKLHTAAALVASSPRLILHDLGAGIYAWDFTLAEQKWSWANIFDGVLYPKTDTLLHFLKKNRQSSINSYAISWANEGDLDDVGLCFKENCIAAKM
ncbi:MAG TPA: hypothetical protein VEK38_00860, partial [Candidatus Bathyarchaeia archaeon]|nr:hypothetical protein [Candidatus Bathyarchaeia archaeon]